MKSNYDRFPAINVPTDGECHAVAGWEAIGTELRAKFGALGDRALPKCVICVDLYHGVWEDEVLAALVAALKPDTVIETREANKTHDEVRAMLAADQGDDRVFAGEEMRRIDRMLNDRLLKCLNWRTPPARRSRNYSGGISPGPRSRALGL